MTINHYNMKRFKLIKEFPGSVKLGAIVKLDELGQYITDSVVIFQKEDIENYPEFWQEVIEKYYEILSFRSITDPNRIFKLLKRGLYSAGTHPMSNTYNISFLLEIHEIYSVKRLSDGEVFTVGDKVNYTFDFDKTFKIDEFKLSENKITAYMYFSDVTCTEDINNLTKIKKQPLFKTAEKAQEYIDLNYPKYSLKDIQDAYKSPKPSILFDSLMDNLQKLNR